MVAMRQSRKGKSQVTGNDDADKPGRRQTARKKRQRLLLVVLIYSGWCAFSLSG